jgi:glycogen synthase
MIADGIWSALKKERKTAYDCSDFSLETMMHKYESIYKELLP